MRPRGIVWFVSFIFLLPMLLFLIAAFFLAQMASRKKAKRNEP